MNNIFIITWLSFIFSRPRMILRLKTSCLLLKNLKRNCFHRYMMSLPKILLNSCFWMNPKNRCCRMMKTCCQS